jgi:hypothetical protein
VPTGAIRVRTRSTACAIGAGVGLLFALAPAQAQPLKQSCGHVVIVTLPGITWADVARYRPPALIAAMQEGAAGSISVRTIEHRTSYSDAYATLGAGARMQGGPGAGSSRGDQSSPLGPPFRSVQASGLQQIRNLAQSAGYGAEPGALGTALSQHDVSFAAIGNGDPGLHSTADRARRWTLLTAMTASGNVDAAVGPSLLQPGSGAFGVSANRKHVEVAVDRSLAPECSGAVVDTGDLARADVASRASGIRSPAVIGKALRATDAVLAHIRQRLDPSRDLLLILSPTSPAALPAIHLGVAIAVGPGFSPGSTLESASTRRSGFVTLPDVAPTILSFRNLPEPAVMDGQPWTAVTGPSDRLRAAVDADAEAVFVDRLQPGVSKAFVALQVTVYLIALLWLVRRERRTPAPGATLFGRALEMAVLAVVAFPVATFLAGMVDAHRLGIAGSVTLLVAITAALVIAVSIGLRYPLDRLLALTSITVLVLVCDLALGAPLELSTVFGYSPIVAGRFAGLGNIGFAVLAASSVLTAALVVHRWQGSRRSLLFAAALFLVTVVADGLPALGSDVGGVIALVPALIITWVLLAGKRPTLRIFLIAIAAVGVALAIFLAFDLSRPAASQTHLARLFDDIRSRGSSALTDTIGRKVRANLQVFRTTVWTLSVPPALVAMAWLLLRPRGRWHQLAETYPRLRAGLVGALLVGVFGFAVNDSGIVIPAVVLAFFVPLAVLLHLSLLPAELQ